MDDTVLKLLEELEQVVDEGRSSPFSNKVQVDKDEIFEIIDEIKMKLPNEIKQSKWVIEERNKILVDAQKEAVSLLRSMRSLRRHMSRPLKSWTLQRRALKKCVLVRLNTPTM